MPQPAKSPVSTGFVFPKIPPPPAALVDRIRGAVSPIRTAQAVTDDNPLGFDFSDEDDLRATG